MATVIKSPDLAEIGFTLSLEAANTPLINAQANSVALNVVSNDDDGSIETAISTGEFSHVAPETPEIPVEDPRIQAGLIREESLQNRIRELEAAIEKMSSQAIEAGYREGHAQGNADARKAIDTQYAHQLKALAEVVQSAQSSLTSLLTDAQPLIGDIIFGVVCKLIGNQFQTTEGRLSAIRHAIVDIKVEEIVALHLSPDDFESLKSLSPDAPSWVLDLSRLPLQVDTNIGVGGCVVHLKNGQLDARIETQFRRFSQSLKDAIEHA
jgi:flagellar biosynthesis/type III secretory pathway protein FliH